MSVSNCFWLATCKADSRGHNLHLSHKCSIALKTFMIHPNPRQNTNLGTIVNQINNIDVFNLISKYVCEIYITKI